MQEEQVRAGGGSVFWRADFGARLMDSQPRWSCMHGCLPLTTRQCGGMPCQGWHSSQENVI
eukprot:1155115-Pelagomonas_calceolata.AAC.7